MAEGRILIGDCRQALAGLTEKVHVCVTSPPYWGLRDYGNDGQIGLERTPEAYIANMLDVFRAVRRVLRDDGVAWLNLGDTYASGEIGRHDAKEGGLPGASGKGHVKEAGAKRQQARTETGLKPGDLVGIPWRVALALQADGWYLRSDVIWAKRNTMPESVQGWRWERCRVKVRGAEWSPCPGCPKCSDNEGYVLRRGSWRPTKAHEMVFMLAKSERYFADGEGVKESALQPTGAAALTGQHKAGALGHTSSPTSTLGSNQGSSTRNLRDVWTLSSTPSKLRHFAMMPPALVEKCILSGPEKVCEACGAPWARVVEIERADREDRRQENAATTGRRDGHTPAPRGEGASGYRKTSLGFRPTCACGAPAVPPLILDPFLGAGTVAGVAEVLGRRWAGCELSADYAALVPQRIDEVRAFFERRAGRRTERARPPGPGQTSLFSLFGDQP